MSTPGGIQSYYGEMSEMFWAMNFTISFHVLDNLTELFTTVPGNEYIGYYYSGFMFTDEFEIYTYGGLEGPEFDDSNPQPADIVYGYKLYQASPGVAAPSLGPFSTTLPNNLTRYITDGAGVSVPSEKLAFYFGGMTNFECNVVQCLAMLLVPSDLLIQMDMSNPRNTLRLESDVTSRGDLACRWTATMVTGFQARTADCTWRCC